MSGGASAGTAIPTLDLHGMRREPAVRELVAFLERHMQPADPSSCGKPQAPAATVVRVITGLGQHSSSQGGPVLRHAVQEFLQRRGFVFGWERGCFTVNVAKGKGGSLTYHRQASDEDTKLVLMDGGQQRQQHSPRRKQHLQGRIVSSSQIAGGSGNAMIRHSACSNSDPQFQLMAGPSLAEVARADAELERGKEESLQAYRVRLKQVHRERREYEAALKQSQQQQVVDDDEEEQALIQKAILEEQRLLERHDREEEELIQQAIEEEQKLLERQQREEEEMLQRALEMSSSSAHWNYCDDDCEEDEMLRRALELSSQQQQQPEFSTIGSIYLNEQEDELLQHAIRASQQIMLAADDDAGFVVPAEVEGTTSSVVEHNHCESCLCHDGGGEHTTSRKDDDDEEEEDVKH